ncbi:MAG TPA: hypothetical protein PKZ84_17705 [Anaerolineae bacterium]|nr:hypothetical protein [Anaerolineae bacterium]HQI86410.1 hypothetical protein [Anaerolineae bacterium]
MSDLLRLSVVAPGKTLLEATNVGKVRLKLADQAWLSIYPRHAPLLAETLAGPVTYTSEAGDATLFVSESILQVVDNTVTLFASGELTAPVTATASDASGDIEDEDAARFDRLARVLLQSLNAQPVAGLDEFTGETTGGGA